MERLQDSELRTLTELAGAAYAQRSPEEFARQVLQALSAIIPCDNTLSFNVADIYRRRITWITFPEYAPVPWGQEVLERHLREHPTLSRVERAPDRPHKISDAVSVRQFHRLPVYNEYYRWCPLGRIEHQMVLPLHISPSLSAVIALNRTRRDFTERQRLMLHIVRPFLAQAFRATRALALAYEALATTASARARRGLLVLAQDGRIRMRTPGVTQWLGEYFAGSRLDPDVLPDDLARWVHAQDANLADTSLQATVPAPLEISQEDRHLTCWWLRGWDESILVFEEHRVASVPAGVTRLGLTDREAQVLALVAQGKTNRQIATLCRISPRTVQIHLDHVFRKLNVHTRTAAVACALGAAQIRF